MLVAMIGVLSHYISKPDIIKTTLKECKMVLSLTFAFAGGGGGSGGCFYFGFLGNALFSRIHFFGMRSLFWGDFWASIFFNGISNSPTSSSLWPSPSSLLFCHLLFKKCDSTPIKYIHLYAKFLHCLLNKLHKELYI